MIMSKLTLTEAVKVISVSQATLYRDLKKGKVSFETNGKDRRLIDVSELERVYGELKTPEQSGKGSENTAETFIDTSQNVSLTNNDNQKKIAMLETQVQELKNQITAEREEKTKLLDLADRLQRQNEILMLPSAKRKGWLDFFKFRKTLRDNV